MAVGGYNAPDRDLLKHIATETIEYFGVTVLQMNHMAYDTLTSRDTRRDFQPPLPSWVPDWTNCCDVDRVLFGLHYPCMFNNRQGSFVSLSDDEEILAVCGYALDRVAKLIQSPVPQLADRRRAKFRMSSEIRQIVQRWA